MLSRHKTWDAFYNDISLQDFVDQKIPKIRFKKEVNSEVKNAFEIVHKLLVHSYFEYLFIDIAVTRALHVFEMALKIRFRELNSGKDWPKKAPLVQLINWFRDRNYFEIDNPEFFKHIRDRRNYLSHPTGHHFGGAVGLPWITTALDLINDLYEDLNLRAERKALEKKFIEELSLFLQNGIKYSYLDDVAYIYSHGPVVVNNRTKIAEYAFGLLPMFDHTSFEAKAPLIICMNQGLDAKEREVKLIDTEGNQLILTNDLSELEREEIKEFKKELQLNESMNAQHQMLIFDTEKNLLAIRRDFLFKDDHDNTAT